jgi:hypothetical protein
MLRNHLPVAAIALLALPSIASAIGIGVIGGDPPGPLLVTTQLGEVQPTSGNCDANGDCTFIFNNNTGGIITSLSFSMDINPALTQQQISSLFSCTQGVSGYFLNCGETEAAGQGGTEVLTYLFSGVLPPEAAESCPTGNCAPAQRGIPPDTVPTDPEFSIQLTGWLANAMVGDTPAFTNGVLPTFTNTFTATPEPSTLAFLGIVFLLTVGTAQFRRSRLAASRRSA